MLVHQFNTEMTVVSIVHYVVFVGKKSLEKSIH